MKIAFFRHGEALSASEAGVSLDSERPLSENGKKGVLDSAKNLKKEGFSPSLIIASPFLRARETAGILSLFFKLPPAITAEELTTFSSPDRLLSCLLKKAEGADLIIVGHQPLLAITASRLAGETSVRLSPAGYALVELLSENPLSARLLSNRNLKVAS